jgi:hypothetical protein
MTDVQLKMVVHALPRWLIKLADAHAQPVEFPSEGRIQELWSKHVPGHGELFMGSSVATPTMGFYVEIQSGTRPAPREKFLKALAAECHIRRSEPINQEQWLDPRC